MTKLRRAQHEDKLLYHFWCPGCKVAHGFQVPGWAFNNDMNSPTVTPSLLSTGGDRHCHLFITEGKLQFLTDCNHVLAGKIVDIPEWPYG
jgi:hypothetical protein